MEELVEETENSILAELLPSSRRRVLQSQVSSHSLTSTASGGQTNRESIGGSNTGAGGIPSPEVNAMRLGDKRAKSRVPELTDYGLELTSVPTLLPKASRSQLLRSGSFEVTLESPEDS